MKVLPVEYGLILAGVLFVLGLISVLIRRNIIFMLISVEIMLNAAGLAFIAAGARWGQADGQVMFIFILTMAAARSFCRSGTHSSDLSPIENARQRCR